MDGGMFLRAAEQIGQNHFVLPANLDYATQTPSVPFCYPPFGFYLLALLKWLGLSLEAGLRFVPAAFATASIWSLWMLARAVFADEPKRDVVAGLAALFWALTPGSFGWMVMGGGATRAPAFFFALWGVERAIAFWRDGKRAAFWHTAILLALTLATHLERARFFGIALLVVWLVFNRTFGGLGRVGACVGAGLVLCSPWWGVCLARFGTAPFAASFASGSRDALGGYSGQLGVGLGGESLFPVLTCLALGGFWLFRRRAPFLWVWYFVIWALELRSGTTFITLPIALAAAAFVATAPRFLSPALGVLSVGWLLLETSGTAQGLRSLSPQVRAAMSWCRQNSPPNARFVVFPATTNTNWATDLEGEWFPALANRAAPLTVQGSEWLPDNAFALRQKWHAQVCRLRNWPEMQRDLRDADIHYEWIFWPRSKRLGTKRHTIQLDLAADPRWRIAFQNEDVLVFARREPVPGSVRP